MMKAGQGRILFKRKWYRWEEKEKIEGEIERIGGSKGEDGKGEDDRRKTQDLG